MGEPLLNLDRVLEAVAALNDPAKLGLGARHITVSTSGVVPGIRRLTALGPQFTLAISLHAARERAARRAGPAEPALAGRRGRRRGPRARPRDGPADQLRDDDDRGRERHRRRCRRGRGAPARRPRARQPDPDEPGRAHALARQPDARDRAVRGDGSRPRGSRSRSGATAAPRSARRAASSPPSGREPHRRPRSPCDAQRLEAASAAGTPRRAQRRAGAGRRRRLTRDGMRRIAAVPRRAVDRPRPGRGEHPRCRPRQPRLRRAARRARGRRPHPPRRDGRPLRAEYHVRGEDDRGAPEADAPAVRRPPDDRQPRPAHRRLPRRGLRLGDDPRRDRGGHRADAPSRSGRPVAPRACASSRRRRSPRSSRIGSSSTSSWS